MRTITETELKKILADHKEWAASGTTKGQRADLQDADLQRANLQGADLQDADLQGADLRGPDLQGANLQGANLQGADLRGANLQGADLQRADLQGANLQGANLQGADLRGANLQGADLQRADLQGANLRGPDLRGANLQGAKNDPIRDDFFAVLASAPKEAIGLYKALVDGRVNGSSYSGECACLVGTIAHVRGVDYQKLEGLAPDSNRPAERWFLGIGKGDTPENNPVSEITAEWLRDWAKENGIELPMRKVVWEEQTFQERSDG